MRGSLTQHLQHADAALSKKSMSKPRLAGFPAALFLTGLGLGLYYADAWWRLPQYSESDIAASVELNMAMDLRRQGLTAIPTAEESALRIRLKQELRQEIARERNEALRGLGAGVLALVLSLGQLFWWRRHAARVQVRTAP